MNPSQMPTDVPTVMSDSDGAVDGGSDSDTDGSDSDSDDSDGNAGLRGSGDDSGMASEDLIFFVVCLTALLFSVSMWKVMQMQRDKRIEHAAREKALLNKLSYNKKAQRQAEIDLYHARNETGTKVTGETDVVTDQNGLPMQRPSMASIESDYYVRDLHHGSPMQHVSDFSPTDEHEEYAVDVVEMVEAPAEQQSGGAMSLGMIHPSKRPKKTLKPFARKNDHAVTDRFRQHEDEYKQETYARKETGSDQPGF